MIDLLDLLAQTAPALETTITTQPTQGAPPSGLFQLLTSGMMPLILGVLVLYFLLFRSKRNQDKARQQVLAGLKKGDEVQTIGGMLGKVVEAREDRVLVKVDESSNTKIWFTRSAIHRVVTGDAPATK